KRRLRIFIVFTNWLSVAAGPWRALGGTLGLGGISCLGGTCHLSGIRPLYGSCHLDQLRIGGLLGHHHGQGFLVGVLELIPLCLWHLMCSQTVLKHLQRA